MIRRRPGSTRAFIRDVIAPVVLIAGVCIAFYGFLLPLAAPVRESLQWLGIAGALLVAGWGMAA